MKWLLLLLAALTLKGAALPTTTNDQQLTTTNNDNNNNDNTTTAPKFQGGKVLIAVASAPAHRNNRNAIRETWGKQAIDFGFDVKFFIGELGLHPKNEQQEQALNNEAYVVRLHDFEEAHSNLSSKTVDLLSYGGAKGYDVVVKMDDTSYLNVFSMGQALQSVGNLNHLYGGLFIRRKEWLQPQQQGKYYMGDQLEFGEKWPEYAAGAGFAVGSAALNYINKNRKSLTKYRKDDVAVAKWLSEVPEMKQVEWNASLYQHSVNPRDSGIWVSPLSSEDMRTFYELEQRQLVDGGVQLNQEVFVPSVCVNSCLCSGGDVDEEGVARCWEGWKKDAWKDSRSA